MRKEGNSIGGFTLPRTDRAHQDRSEAKSHGWKTLHKKNGGGGLDLNRKSIFGPRDGTVHRVPFERLAPCLGNQAN